MKNNVFARLASSFVRGGFVPVKGAVVAADNNTPPQGTADQIEALRRQLEGGGETFVNSDGTVNNPADPATASSLAAGGYKPVKGAVVAADNNTSPQGTADQIEALRRQLEGGGETFVNSDGTVNNPADPATASSLAAGGYKPVKGTVVAADNNTPPQGTADQIEALRRQLEGGGETFVNSDGTVNNPADPATASSLAAGGYKPVKGAVVAAPEQWYMKNPALQRAEIAAMADIKPDAQCGFRADGKMYWVINLNPVVCGKRCRWTLLAVYDDDHPQKRWGGSVKFYPVKPNVQEMQAMVARSRVTPKTIPHLLTDEQGQLYMCTQDRNRIEAGVNKGDRVDTAASCLRYAMRWITVFELGLIDQRTWTLFQGHGQI